MKKFLSIMAVMLIMLLSVVPAFAANDPVLTGPKDGNSYSIFQIFTGKISDGKLTDVKYGASAKVKDEVKGTAVPSTILDTIAALDGTEAANAKAIAAYADFTKAFKTIDDTTATASLPTGYYLISKAGDNGSAAGTPIYFIKVVSSDITFAPKTDETKLDKVIVDDGKDVKGVEGVKDDVINFKVTVTVSDRYDADYTAYKLAIKDKLSAGLQYVATPAFKIMDGTTDITSSFTFANKDNKGQELSWTCADLKKVTSVKAGDTIVLTYSAKVLANAGTENTNAAVCEYSNNPYDATKTATTPESKVYVNSCKLVINKVDDEGQPLGGATFKLVDSSQAEKTVVTSNEGKTFTWNDLVAGTYTLTETVTPSGYNEIEPISIEIELAQDESGEITYSVKGDFEADGQTVSADIVNAAGSILPATGGIGTKIFYIVGGATVLGALIVLISRRKVNGAEA